MIPVRNIERVPNVVTIRLRLEKHSARFNACKDSDHLIVMELRYGFIFNRIYLPRFIATAVGSTFAFFSTFFVMWIVCSLSKQYIYFIKLVRQQIQ